MNGITGKFSIFDYFNSVIGGIIFLIGIGCFTYSNSVDRLIQIANTIGESTFLLIMVIIMFIAVASVVGSVINAMGSWLLRKLPCGEPKLINACLTDVNIIGNRIKFDNYRQKATRYFKLKNDSKEKMSFTIEQCNCFFAHCVYYNQIRNQNEKTERLRDVQGLSCILASVFAVLAVIGEIVSLLGSNSCRLTLVYILFTIVFVLKYKYDVQCRVRMVLAVYDVTVEREIAEHKHKGAI